MEPFNYKADHFRSFISTYQMYTICTQYSTDFTKWDKFFISHAPGRDRRRIGCAQRMKWARAPTRFGPGNYTRPNSTWACTQYTVWRLTWML